MLTYEDAENMCVRVSGRLEKDIAIDVPFSELRDMIGEDVFEEAAGRWGLEALKRSEPIFHVHSTKGTVTVSFIVDGLPDEEALWEIDLLEAIKDWFCPQDYIDNQPNEGLDVVVKKLRDIADHIEQARALLDDH